MIDLRYKDGVVYDTSDNGEEIFKLSNSDTLFIIIVNRAIVQTSHQLIAGEKLIIDRQHHIITIPGISGSVKSYITLYPKLKYLVTCEKDEIDKRLKVTIDIVGETEQDD